MITGNVDKKEIEKEIDEIEETKVEISRMDKQILRQKRRKHYAS